MLGRASYNNIATNANEEDGADGLNLAEDLEGRKKDDSAVAAQVATVIASISKKGDDFTWTDNYFADHRDIVAAFDFHQDKNAHSKAKCIWYYLWNESECGLDWIILAVLFPLLVLLVMVPETYSGLPIMAFCHYCFLGFITIARCQPQVAWIPHLAITTTGVRYVEPPEKWSRFLGSTVHIPLEAIVAIEINNAANVAIRTLSSDWTDYVVSGAPRGLRKIWRYKCRTEWKEEIVKDGQDCNGTRLDINHLLEPYRFKKLVMSLKQKEQVAKRDKKEEEIDKAIVC